MTNLSVVSEGINQVIKSYGLESELEKGSKTDWSTNLKNLARKNFPWVRNYLHGEDASDMEYELIIQMFQKVFLERADKVFSSFKKSDEEGHQAKLEAFIHFIMDRATAEVSKIQYKKYKEQYEDTYSVSPYEGETEEEALDRMTGNSSLPVADQLIYDSLLDKLKIVMSDRGSYTGDVEVLTLLLEGYTKSEVARQLGVAESRISRRIASIKEDIEELAVYFAYKGDASLLTLLNKYKILNVPVNRVEEYIKDDVVENLDEIFDSVI